MTKEHDTLFARAGEAHAAAYAAYTAAAAADEALVGVRLRKQLGEATAADVQLAVEAAREAARVSADADAAYDDAYNAYLRSRFDGGGGG